MALENFTTYTEVDPNSRIAKTSTKVTWTLLQRDEDAYVYKDKGADYFDGDFTHLLAIRLTAGDTSGFVKCWCLANLVDDAKGIEDVSGDYLAIYIKKSFANTMAVEECDGGSLTALSTGSTYELELNTTYYLKVIRDESVGTYGTIYLYIYSDSARTTLLATQSITLNTSKKDFRYIYACQSYNAASSEAQSAYTENLNIFKADAGYAATYPINELLRASGIRRTFWAGLGGQSIYQVELALGGMSTSYVSPIGSRDIPSAVTPEPNLKATYEQWLNYYITNNLAGLIKTFGHIPTYEEWVNWIKQGQTPYFPKYF